jgi:predicted SAM-dependent methyltransferase
MGESVRGYIGEVIGMKLNLGCGYNHIQGYVNIDNRPEVHPDLLCDVLEGLPYGDNTVDEVLAQDFLEHIPIGKVIGVMENIWRVLKIDGMFESVTPSTDGRGAFQDPTHVSFWNQNSWLYYSEPHLRALYGIKANFEIVYIKDETVPMFPLTHELNHIVVIETHVIARRRR